MSRPHSNSLFASYLVVRVRCNSEAIPVVKGRAADLQQGFNVNVLGLSPNRNTPLLFLLTSSGQGSCAEREHKI